MRVFILIGMVLIAGCDTHDFRTERSSRLVGSRSGETEHDSPSTYPVSGLMAYFPFDGDVSNVTSDLHRGQNHGATFTTDRLGNSRSAIQFDGIDNFISFTESNILQVQLPVSLSFWVKPDQNRTTSAVITTSYDSSENTGVFAAFDSNGGNPSISIGGGEGLGISSRRTLHAISPLVPGEWYHIVGVVESAASMRLFINGIEVAGDMDGDANDIKYGGGPMVFGRRISSKGSPPIYFQGALDDVAIYGHALNQSDVSHLFRGSPDGSVDVRDDPGR